MGQDLTFPEQAGFTKNPIFRIDIIRFFGFTSPMQPSRIHEDLGRLLDERGLLREVSKETGIDYKRIHEIVTKKCDPGFSRGKKLEAWIRCASMLEATRRDIEDGREIPFQRWQRLDELKDEFNSSLRIKIDCALELIFSNPARRANPTKEVWENERRREEQWYREAKDYVRWSIRELADGVVVAIQEAKARDSTRTSGGGRHSDVPAKL